MSATAAAIAPPRSAEQRTAALRIANDVRTRRAQLKRDLKSREIQVVPLLQEPPAWIETMRVFDLLLAAPKLGRVKVTKVLNRCRVAPSKTVGGLSPRQRDEIIAAVQGPVS